MKKTVLTIALAVFALTAVSAQDIITKTNGDEIQAKVTEVNKTEVKYKKFSNQQGPTYTLPIAEIFMIKYESGDKDVFDKKQAAENVQTPVVAKAETPAVEPSAQKPVTASSKMADYGNLPTYKYMFGNTINPQGPQRSKSAAGWLSFLVPGVGQFYNGDVGGGFFFLGTTLLSNGLLLATAQYDIGETYANITFNPLWVITSTGLWIWGICDANSRAKKVNMARGYALGNGYYMKLEPTLIQNELAQSALDSYAAGMSLKINF